MPENRFGNLMSGLNTSSTDTKPSAPKAKKKRKKTATEADIITPTRRDEEGPKMPRNRHPGREIGLAKSRDPRYEKGTYYILKEITHAMRIYAASNKMQMSELVAKAVKSYMERYPIEDD